MYWLNNNEKLYKSYELILSNPKRTNQDENNLIDEYMKFHEREMNYYKNKFKNIK